MVVKVILLLYECHQKSFKLPFKHERDRHELLDQILSQNSLPDPELNHYSVASKTFFNQINYLVMTHFCKNTCCAKKDEHSNVKKKKSQKTSQDVSNKICIY